MDNPVDQISNKENGEGLTAPCPDPAVPSTEPGDTPSSLSAPAADASSHDEERGSPTPTGEPNKDEESKPSEAKLEPSPADVPPPEHSAPGSNPTAQDHEDNLTAQESNHPPLFTIEVADSVSSHSESSPDSSLATPDSDSAMPPASTAPSSTRTSLTDTQPSSSKTPPSILRGATLPRSASMTAVTFAPLPPTEPRRRASHMQLGVAARSRMLRGRRMRLVDPDTGEPVHVVDAAVTEHQHGVRYAYPGEEGEEMYVVHGHRPPNTPYAGMWQAGQGSLAPDEDSTPEEDALIALGKMMKGGAKSLWRKMSKSGLRQVDGELEGEKRPRLARSASEPVGSGSMTGSSSSDETGTLPVVEYCEPRHCFDESETSKPPPKPSSTKSLPATPIVKTSETLSRPSKEEEVGRVWEEEVDDDIRRRFGAISREKEKEKAKNTLIGRIASLKQIKAAAKKTS